LPRLFARLGKSYHGEFAKIGLGLVSTEIILNFDAQGTAHFG
jgi:hypothetical protein